MAKNGTRVRYINQDGDAVPGVTTVLNLLNKPHLVIWANKLGLQGIEVGKYVDNLADIGSLAHYLIMCHFAKIEPDTKDYTPNQLEQAQNCLKSFWNWAKPHTFETILVEHKVISDLFNYGGTPDWYGFMDGIPTLLDFKTGKAIYDEYFYQAAAYKNGLEEMGYIVEQAKIIRIGRDNDEGFEERTKNHLDREFKLFLHLLDIYYIKKDLNK